MKKTKKLLTGIFTAAMAVSLVACGNSSGVKKEESKAETVESTESKTEISDKTTYPEKTITVVCSWAAGGQADTVCRIMTDLLSSELGVPVVVENVKGNGGQVAAIEYMNKEADGYTLLYTSDVVQYLSPLVSNIEYDPEQMVPICTTASNGFGLIVNSDTGATNLEEFKAYADEVGSVTCGVTGKTGAITYELLNNLFKKMEINADFIVYDNGPAVTTDVVGKHIDCGIAIDPQNDQYAQDGSVNYIASFLEDGHAIEGLGKVESVTSQGYDIACANPNMIVCKAGTDQAIIDKLTESVEKIKDEFDTKCEELGYTPVVTTGDELESYIADLKVLYEDMAK